MSSTFHAAPPLFGKKNINKNFNRGSQPDIPKRHLEDLGLPVNGQRDVQSFYLSGSTDITKHINERWQQKQAVEALKKSEVGSDHPMVNYNSRCHPAVSQD
mmetsp:Transcript_3396/g.5100  ORF Transcript_3396/g.5100 Transcript_3396/m.5100 type:complete len:101 (+) Transcript_3396:480-782(+)